MERCAVIQIFVCAAFCAIAEGILENHLQVIDRRLSWKDRTDALRSHLEAKKRILDARRRADANIRAMLEEEQRLRQQGLLHKHKLPRLKTNISATLNDELTMSEAKEDSLLTEVKLPSLSLENESETTSPAIPTPPFDQRIDTATMVDSSTISKETLSTASPIVSRQPTRTHADIISVPRSSSEEFATATQSVSVTSFASPGGLNSPSLHREGSRTTTVSTNTRTNKISMVPSDSIDKQTHTSGISAVVTSNENTNITTSSVVRLAKAVPTHVEPLELEQFRNGPKPALSNTSTSGQATTTGVPAVTTQGAKSPTAASPVTAQATWSSLPTTGDPWDSPDFFGPLGVAVFEDVMLPIDPAVPVAQVKETTPGTQTPRPRQQPEFPRSDLVSRFLTDISRWFLNRENPNLLAGK